MKKDNKVLMIFVGIISLLIVSVLINWGIDCFVSYKINKILETKYIEIPYAKVAIQPKTEITIDMIEIKSVPENLMPEGDFYKYINDIVGKYSDVNTVIEEGSLFYKNLLTEKKYLSDSYKYDVPSGNSIINYSISKNMPYGNSIMPGDYIDIYIKSSSEKINNEVMFGKFLSNIHVLAIKDKEGQHVFENPEEVRIPAYMLFALPEEQHLLLRKILYLQEESDIELLFIPNTEELPNDIKITISDKDIVKFINERTTNVNMNDLPIISE